MLSGVSRTFYGFFLKPKQIEKISQWGEVDPQITSLNTPLVTLEMAIFDPSPTPHIKFREKILKFEYEA